MRTLRKFNLRSMTASDANMLVSAVCDCYGKSYPDKRFYNALNIKNMIDNQTLFSCLAVGEQGEIGGHLGIFLNPDFTDLGYGCCGMVTSAFRGNLLLARMLAWVTKRICARSLPGYYYEVVSTYPFAQSSALASGGIETGFYPAHLPASLCYRHVFSKKNNLAYNAFLFFKCCSCSCERHVFACPEISFILEKIYKRLEVKRIIQSIANHKFRFDQQSVHKERIAKSWGTIDLAFNNLGNDFADVLKKRLKTVDPGILPRVYVHLPLGNPDSISAFYILQNMGFFFAGVVPEFFRGEDSLCLQKIEGEIDWENNLIVSDHGIMVKDFVYEQWKTIR